MTEPQPHTMEIISRHRDMFAVGLSDVIMPDAVRINGQDVDVAAVPVQIREFEGTSTVEVTVTLRTQLIVQHVSEDAPQPAWVFQE